MNHPVNNDFSDTVLLKSSLHVLSYDWAERAPSSYECTYK